MCRYRRGGPSGRGGMGGYQDEYGGDESFDSQEDMGQGWGGRGRPRGGPPRGGKTFSIHLSHQLPLRPLKLRCQV